MQPGKKTLQTMPKALGWQISSIDTTFIFQPKYIQRVSLNVSNPLTAKPAANEDAKDNHLYLDFPLRYFHPLQYLVLQN